jgi:hypothetical protein
LKTTIQKPNARQAKSKQTSSLSEKPPENMKMTQWFLEKSPLLKK